MQRPLASYPILCRHVSPMLDLTELYKIAEKYRDALHQSVREFEIGGRPFHFNTHPYLMGVVNLSPDSWYRESVCLSTEQAIHRGHRLAAEGAHLIDVGAESSL